MQLTDTVALVTGAGHRLGRAIALGLAEAGCHVMVHFGRSDEDAEETARRIRLGGREAETASADLADPQAIESLFERIEARFGRLDVLVNSAATFERSPFEAITADAWDAVHRVNLRAPFLCTRRAASLMRASERRSEGDEGDAPAAVVNLADLAGVTTWRGYAHHGVSKAGLLHLTRVSARELAPEVRVNAIVPGPILPPPGESRESASWRAKGARVPMAKPGEPAHVAGAVVFLARNDYVCGATLFVDGGEHLLAGGRDR